MLFQTSLYAVIGLRHTMIKISKPEKANIMKLSIITINYNNAEGLRKTLASVASQTYRNIEHIIIDGGSTDGSVDVIKEYESSNRSSIHPLTIIWSSEPDKGIYNAMNKGIEIALGRRIVNSFNRSELVDDKHGEADRPKQSGAENKDAEEDYIQILNSGDILAADDVTARMVAALDSLNAKHSTLSGDAVSILYGNMLKSYDGKTIIHRDTCGGDMYTPESFLYFYKGTLNHDCAYIRRDLFEKYGLYNEQMKICSDWEWYVRVIVFGGEKPVYTNIDVTIFDMNGVSESYGKNADIIKRERREYLESILPPAVLHDYDAFSFPIQQYQRLKKYHLWGIVWFFERVLFKLEKWRILRG